MIDRIYTLETALTIPYRNLALEKYLTETVEDGECILYLWQNRGTVVIGRNQNCFKECNVRALEQDGGFLARRLSGGGAVFHDMGNLNYTFIARKQNYNVERQLEVMLRAVGMFGIDAERTGRNDIAVKGRKFSGNAFYHSGDCRCHHGTLLINEDREHMSRYLNVSQEKLKSKSVDSVNARVTNLSELCPEITVKGMKKRMVQAYSECYKLPVRPLPASRIDESAVDENERFFSSSAWIYGRRVKSNCRITRRFEWGDVSVELLVNGGRIKSANVFSDAMEQDFISRLPGAIEGCVYEAEAVKNIIEKIVKATSETGAASRIGADIISLISDAI